MLSLSGQSRWRVVVVLVVAIANSSASCCARCHPIIYGLWYIREMMSYNIVMWFVTKSSRTSLKYADCSDGDGKKERREGGEWCGQFGMTSNGSGSRGKHLICISFHCHLGKERWAVLCAQRVGSTVWRYIRPSISDGELKCKRWKWENQQRWGEKKYIVEQKISLFFLYYYRRNKSFFRTFSSTGAGSLSTLCAC